MARTKSSTLRIRNVVILIGVAVFAVWSLFPIYWMIKSAISEGPVALTFKRLLPNGFSIQAFQDVLNHYVIGRWMLNSLIVSGSSTVVAILFGILSGYSLSRFRFYAKTFFGNILYFTQLLPQSVLLVPIFILYSRIGLTNKLFGLILLNIFFMVPVCTWLLKGFFDSTPIEVEEAAKLDGCSRIRTIFSITIPMNLPGIFATSLFVLMDTWYEWLFAATLVDNQKNWTISASIFVFIGELGIDWKQMMAAGIIATVPTLLIFGLLQSSMMKGIRLGRY